MRIVKPSYQLLTPITQEGVYGSIERAGRTAYKSEGNITHGSSVRFIESILKNGHESVLEHVSLSVRFVCDRGVSHELVRHRLVSYTQESTRYCNYAKKGVTFIRPCFWQEGSAEYAVWEVCMRDCEEAYNRLTESGATPQEARSVLPNSLKTEIITTANIREWRHILRLRTAKAAHPQMRELMIPLLRELQQRLPVLFSDIVVVEEEPSA